MNARFDKVNSAYRNDIMRVNIRQQMAHPMSEFLGTVMIVIVLWFGGTLVLNSQVMQVPPLYIISSYFIPSSIRLKNFRRRATTFPKDWHQWNV